MNQTKKRFNVLRGTFLVTLILLVIQYVLGMFVNLFVQFPDSLPGGNAWSWSFTHTFAIPSHVVIGTSLIVTALVALAMSVRTRHIPAILAAVFGLAMIVYAWLSGASFLSNGQQNTASIQMALGFIGAVIAYGIGLRSSSNISKQQKIMQEDSMREREAPLAMR